MESILIVDDTGSNRFLLRAMLKQSGYTVAECENGAQAVEYCARSKPDLVLLDVMMPVMDGLECCKKLREKFSESELAIIIVTTKDEAETLPEALQAGANDYVSKPVNREVLLARVRNQLALRRSRSEMERALEIQHTTAEALPQALAIVASDGKIIYSNGRWIDACGGSRAETIADALAALYQGGLGAHAVSLMEQSRTGSGVVIDQEFTIPAGAVTNVWVVSRPIAMSDGDNLRLWLMRDITHRRDLERKMNERVRLDTVSLLVKGVCHNFNNIMGAILGAAEILDKHVPAELERPKKAVRIIRQGADSAAQLTRKMSIFAQIDTVGSPQRLEQLEEVLDAVVVIQRERVGDRIPVTLRVQRPLPPVRAGLPQLLEIFNNILSNSIDAIPQKGEIEISVGRDSALRRLVVSVRDTGVGMDQEMCERIFEPFFTTKNLDVRNAVSVDGHGLGLWNVYNLVKVCGGEISVESKKGLGTTVSVKLPYEEAPGSRAPSS